MTEPVNIRNTYGRRGRPTLQIARTATGHPRCQGEYYNGRQCNRRAFYMEQARYTDAERLSPSVLFWFCPDHSKTVADQQAEARRVQQAAESERYGRHRAAERERVAGVRRVEAALLRVAAASVARGDTCAEELAVALRETGLSLESIHLAL